MLMGSGRVGDFGYGYLLLFEMEALLGREKKRGLGGHGGRGKGVEKDFGYGQEKNKREWGGHGVRGKGVEKNFGYALLLLFEMVAHWGRERNRVGKGREQEEGVKGADNL